MAGSGCGLGMTMLIGVAAGAAAGDLGVGRAPRRRAGSARFQHEQRAAFAHDEAVAVGVERARRRLGIVVAARQGAEIAEAGQRHGRDGHVASPGQADVDPAEPEPAACQGEGIVAAGAGGGQADGRPAQGEALAGALDERLDVLLRLEELAAALQCSRFPRRSSTRRHCPAPVRRAVRSGVPRAPRRAGPGNSTRASLVRALGSVWNASPAIESGQGTDVTAAPIWEGWSSTRNNSRRRTAELPGQQLLGNHRIAVAERGGDANARDVDRFAIQSRLPAFS